MDAPTLMPAADTHAAAARTPWRLLLALALFALLSGSFLARSLADYRPVTATPDWGPARWIGPPVAAAVAYYRAELRLAAAPRHAYLQIAAPDSFAVYVNGQAIGSSRFNSVTTFDLMDIAGALQPGRNVIAVRVARTTYPGSATLRLRVLWQDEAGNRDELASDTAWRVALHEEYQPERQLDWSAADFDDSAWPSAQPRADAGPFLLPVHSWARPALFTELPRGEWMGGGQARSSATRFRRDFTLAAGTVDHAWLGIASTGPYTLTVNRARLRSAPASPDATDTYDLGPYLRSGANSIEIELSHLDGEAQLAVAAQLRAGAETIDLSSGAAWQVRGDAGTAWRPALPGSAQASLGSATPAPAGRMPGLRLVELQAPVSLQLQQALRALGWIAAIFAASATTLILAARRRGVRRAAALDALAGPWIFAALLLAAAFLLSFDVTLAAERLFRSAHVAILALVTVLWTALILREQTHARG